MLIKNKMVKWKTINLLTLLMLIPLVAAISTYEMCEEIIEPNTNCTMITLTLTCTNYTYNLTNSTSGAMIVQNNDLTLLNGSLYYFNFTQPEGKYVITLCDGTTREVHVKTEVNKMDILGAIILVPLIIAALLFYISTKLNTEDHWAMSMGLMLLGFLFITTALGLGVQITARYLGFSELQDVMSTTLFGYGWMFYLIVVYFMLYVMIMAIRIVRGKKRTKTGDYNEKGYA